MELMNRSRVGVERSEPQARWELMSLEGVDFGEEPRTRSWET